MTNPPSTLLEASVALPKLPGWVTKPHIATAMRAYAREHEANVRAELARSAQAVPAEHSPAFRRLYSAVNNMVCHIGFEGTIDSRHGFVEETMDALRGIDGGTYSVHITPLREPVGQVVIGPKGDVEGWTVVKWGEAGCPPVGSKLYLVSEGTALPAVTPQVADEGWDVVSLAKALRDGVRQFRKEPALGRLNAIRTTDGYRAMVDAWDNLNDFFYAEGRATPPLMAAVPAQTGGVARMVEALVAHIEAGECHHEDTYRGGAIWTICRGCDNKWADDRGGFKAYKRPAVLVQADKFLAALAHSPTVASPAPVAEVGGLEQLRAELETMTQDRDRLDALVNSPETRAFLTGVRNEVAHQVERWGTVHDRAKEPADWFWLVGYLAGKALASHVKGDTEKAMHHCISTSAALANWHTHILHGAGLMQPGSSDLQDFLRETFGANFIEQQDGRAASPVVIAGEVKP